MERATSFVNGREISADPITNTRSKPRQLIFTGKAKEYFNIWVVNTALTIFTLGIFSAWAKVRKKRYFYGNTFLDNNSFEYLANPLSILKGRLIAALLFVVYWVLTNFVPALILPIIVIVVLLLPWVISRSLYFNALNSAYRGVQFGFSGNYGDAAKTFLLWPILVPFTLGLQKPPKRGPSCPS